MPEDWLISTMYATKRRRRTVKSVKTPAKDPPKSNPSKRHRERLNGELDHLASLLPFEQSVISKLDKLSILRLAVSFLRTKSFFQSVIPARYGIESHLMSRSHLFHEPGFSEGESILQALYGFLFVVTCDGEVFFASRTVEQYLGFHQSDIIHQSVMELIHSEDREEFKRQLSWNSLLPSDKVGMTLHEALMTENVQHLHRSFTVRFRCLLDNTSGFITLEINGFIRVLQGQSQRSDDPQLALFATCSPFGPLSLFDIPSREMTFKTKHKMDFSPVTMDARGKNLFGYMDQEMSAVSGYDLIHPDDLNYFSSAHQELIKTGSSGLIAYRWQTKHLQWLWLQSSCKVIYKNSKPDFIICTHRQLTEDEGQDLYGKRGNEFKLPYPLLDIDMCSGFGFSDDELTLKSKPKSSKKKASNNTQPNGLSGALATANGLSSGGKECGTGGTGGAGGGGSSSSKKSRKSSNCGIVNSIQSYPPYPTGFPAYDGGGEYKLPEMVYPYSGNGFGFDSDLYRTQGYGTFASSFYPAPDPYRMDVDKHGVTNPYFLDAHRQYAQHPGLTSYGTNGYSDFVMSSKYGYDVPKYGFDSYGLELGKRLDGSSGTTAAVTDISTAFDTADIRRYAAAAQAEDPSVPAMAAMNAQQSHQYQPHPHHHHQHPQHPSPHHPHTHHHPHHPQHHSTNPQTRYVPPRFNPTSSIDAVDLRGTSTASMLGATTSFINPIEASVAPPCITPSSLFKPVTPSNPSTLGCREPTPPQNKYPTTSPLCSTNNQSHIPTTELIPSLPLPPLPHSSVIKSTGQSNPTSASSLPDNIHHSSNSSLPLCRVDGLTSYPNLSLTSNSWNSCVNKSPSVTCSLTSSPTSMTSSSHSHHDVTSITHSSMSQNPNGLSNMCRMNSSPIDSIHEEKASDSQTRLPDKEHTAVTGIRVSVVKPSSWLHGYNNNNINNNNNTTITGSSSDNSTNNNISTSVTTDSLNHHHHQQQHNHHLHHHPHLNTNNNNSATTINNNNNNNNNNASLLPFHERDWIDNSSSFYGKNSRVIFPEPCHLVKGINIKPYDRGDNPLLSFSEMTHTLMGSTH